MALNEVIGAYAIVIINNENPHELVAARKSSPLVVGIGDGEYFCASDATPIVEYTKNVVYLEDVEIAQISLKNGFKLNPSNDFPLSFLIVLLSKPANSNKVG